MFAKNLRRLRKNRKLSQQDMAKYLGISRQGYSKYENDNSEPSYEMLVKIADKFDTTTDELLGREVKTSPQQPEPKQTSLFSYEAIGITPKEFEALTAYQQEVVEWAASENGPNFLNKSDNILDMLERLEIAYEVDRVMQERKKKK